MRCLCLALIGQLEGIYIYILIPFSRAINRGVCTQSPVFCIIMEFCPYGPLQNILKDEKVVQPVRIVSWAKQIAMGMQYLHSHKIIHRDLKSPK